MLQGQAYPARSYGNPWARTNCTSHPFLWSKLLSLRHSEGGISQGSPEPCVRPQHHQHPRQGPGTLEEEICLLDSRSPHRGQGGGEGTLGRADGRPGVGCLGGFTVDQTGLAGALEFIDHSPPGAPLYFRVHEDVLGETSPDEDSLDVRRCFNCGSPEHTMSDCPDPLDRALVSLSRQLFNFFRGEWSGPFHRLHEVEEWRRQRLRWLDEFEPGQVKGPLLREALGLSEGDIGERVEWLPRIACWGYPPGWVGVRDPRERVWERAAGVDDSPDEDLEFVIHTDDGPELCLLPGISDADTDATTSSEEGEIKSDSATFPGRWATYPATYFLSSRLPIYKGYSLPAITRDDPPPVSSTYTADRQKLWETILLSSSQGPRPQPTSTPPWRLPGAFGPEVLAHLTTCTALNQLPIAPPSSAPPPPPPSSPPPIPPPSSPPLSCIPLSSSMDYSDTEGDMDLSD